MDGARLDLVAVRNVLVIGNLAGIDDIISCVFLRRCRGDVSGVGLRFLVGGNRLVVKAAVGLRGSNVGGGNAENLLMINVVAFVINVGVVVLQQVSALNSNQSRELTRSTVRSIPFAAAIAAHVSPGLTT